ncbi:homoserine O-acetyltransferase [Kineosporia mesophila]|uniref:Homoserine O-acetyltransferase n=1 Tax=Kineosporia mesophila TaxID=566012 RepID=A0ABP7ATD5_9ACTN|nr:homoserine O-acetyltransferase [Kineosporia mesophila]MCD5353134.1 homoserine O-acetyltransferase [Kineosporia mesophila]
MSTQEVSVPAVPPASGAWRAGDSRGGRKFSRIGNVTLERGGRLDDVEMAYETWGTLSPTGDNAVLVLHALTGDSHVTGDAGPGHPTPGWWNGLIGPGRELDTDRWFVVAPNVLGGCQGSTGPSSPDPGSADGSPYGSRFPYITVRDQVTAEVALSDRLGIDRWALVVGGSMGGMRALEWAVMEPERVERLFVLASTAAATGDQIAWCSAQMMAIRCDANFHGGDYYGAGPGEGPHNGLGVARRIAHTTYRSEAEINLRFGRLPQPGENPLGGDGRFAVESYLDHHADKLTHRFDANSYLVLTQTMNSHDVGRGRGGVAAGLGRVTARTAIAAISSDRLYTPGQNAEIAAGIPDCAPLRVIDSPYGHDGFLVEVERVGEILVELLGEPAQPALATH